MTPPLCPCYHCYHCYHCYRCDHCLLLPLRRQPTTVLLLKHSKCHRPCRVVRRHYTHTHTRAYRSHTATVIAHWSRLTPPAEHDGTFAHGCAAAFLCDCHGLQAALAVLPPTSARRAAGVGLPRHPTHHHFHFHFHHHHHHTQRQVGHLHCPEKTTPALHHVMIDVPQPQHRACPHYRTPRRGHRCLQQTSVLYHHHHHHWHCHDGGAGRRSLHQESQIQTRRRHSTTRTQTGHVGAERCASSFPFRRCHHQTQQRRRAAQTLQRCHDPPHPRHQIDHHRRPRGARVAPVGHRSGGRPRRHTPQGVVA